PLSNALWGKGAAPVIGAWIPMRIFVSVTPVRSPAPDAGGAGMGAVAPGPWPAPAPAAEPDGAPADSGLRPVGAPEPAAEPAAPAAEPVEPPPEAAEPGPEAGDVEPPDPGADAGAAASGPTLDFCPQAAARSRTRATAAPRATATFDERPVMRLSPGWTIQ